MKITATFRASRRLRFEDTKRIMSPEMRPKSFGTLQFAVGSHLALRFFVWVLQFSSLHKDQHLQIPNRTR